MNKRLRDSKNSDNNFGAKVQLIGNGGTGLRGVITAS